MPTPHAHRRAAIVTAEWRGHVAHRPDESATEYVRRLKGLALDDAGEAVRQAVAALVRMHSATEMARMTGAGLEELLRPTERNKSSAAPGAVNTATPRGNMHRGAGQTVHRPPRPSVNGARQRGTRRRTPVPLSAAPSAWAGRG